MSDETEVSVNFGKPMPVFPLGAVTLLPHSVMPYVIFEPRYRQMVEDALDGPGQIAVGVFEGEDWKQDYQGTPALREVVCVAQITKHQKLPDGRYHVWMQGICRARILSELGPEDPRLYRMALLEPIGVSDVDEDSLGEFREQFSRLLTESPLSQLVSAAPLARYLENEEVPTSAIMELLTESVLSDAQTRYYPELRYALLAEPDAKRRAQIILAEMNDLRRLLDRASKQRHADAPRGCTWN